MLIWLAAGAIAQPLSSLAQRDAVRRIGWLEPGTPASFAARRIAFLEVLHEQGYVEGKNLAVDFRHAHGKIENFPALAVELVALKSECILA